MRMRGRKPKKNHPFQLYALNDRWVFVGYFKSFEDAVERAQIYVRNNFCVELLERRFLNEHLSK